MCSFIGTTLETWRSSEEMLMSRLSLETRKKLSESHKGRIAWNKGKKGCFSEESRKKMGESRKGLKNHFYGKHHTEESRKKMSVKLKGRIPWNKGITHSDETKEKIRKKNLNKIPKNKGISHTEKVKEKMRLAWIERKKKPGYNPINKKLIEASKKYNESIRGIPRSENVKEKIRIARLKQVIPKKDTSIEIIFQKELEKRNINFIKHPNIENICQADFLIPDYNIVIFCDGCYWHGPCPLKCVKKINIKQKNKDIINTNKLSQIGYIIYRFWEHEINTDVKSCVDKMMLNRV